MTRKSAGNKVGARNHRHRHRIEWTQFRTARNKVTVPVRFGCRRRLTFGHPVNAIIHDEVQHVDVSSTGVNEVISPDRESIAIAPDCNDLEIGARKLDPGRGGKRTAMYAMKS